MAQFLNSGMKTIDISSFFLGLRFLRALRIMSLPDIMQYLRILKSNSRLNANIRLIQVISVFLAVWLTSAGVVHLVIF